MSEPKIHPGGALSCPTCGEQRFYPTVDMAGGTYLKLDCANLDCVYFAEVTAPAFAGDTTLDIR